MNRIKNLFQAVFILSPCLALGDVTTSIVTSYATFPKSSPLSFDNDLTVELKTVGRLEISEWTLEYDLVGRKSQNDEGKNIVEPRQFFIGRSIGEVDVYIGNRQLFWGVAESKNVVDFVNQKDAAAGRSAENKLGAPSVSLEFYLSDAEFQYIYIPVFREQTFNDQFAHLGLGLSLNDADFSDEKGFYGGDHAFRYSNSLGDLDFGINGFYGTARDPIILVDGNNGATPYYPEYRAVGVDLQYTGDNTLYKAEVAIGEQDATDTTAYVLGIENTLYSVGNSNWDFGIIVETQYDDRPQAISPRFDVGGLRLTANNANDTNAILLYYQDESRKQKSYVLQFSHRLRNGVTLEVEYIEFYSSDAALPFHNFIDDTSLQIGVGIYF